MAISQRYVSPPPRPVKQDSVSQLFEQFYDREGPKTTFRQEWQKMTLDQRQAIQEEIHDRLMQNFRAMPPQLILVFRYLFRVASYANTDGSLNTLELCCTVYITL